MLTIQYQRTGKYDIIIWRLDL